MYGLGCLVTRSNTIDNEHHIRYWQLLSPADFATLTSWVPGDDTRLLGLPLIVLLSPAARFLWRARGSPTDSTNIRNCNNNTQQTKQDHETNHKSLFGLAT